MFYLFFWVFLPAHVGYRDPWLEKDGLKHIAFFWFIFTNTICNYICCVYTDPGITRVCLFLVSGFGGETVCYGVLWETYRGMGSFVLVFSIFPIMRVFTKTRNRPNQVYNQSELIIKVTWLVISQSGTSISWFGRFLTKTLYPPGTPPKITITPDNAMSISIESCIPKEKVGLSILPVYLPFHTASLLFRL